NVVRVRECVDRRADGTRHVAGGVDDGVEGAPLERREVVVPVTVQMLCLGEEIRVRPAAVEERQLVAAFERDLRDGTADELRPSEDEQLQTAPLAGTPSRSSSSSRVSTSWADSAGVRPSVRNVSSASVG